jgi:arsenate reductase
MAEAILNRTGAGRFRAYSAGSQPKGEPHPFAIELLQARGYDVSGLRSKSWNEFSASHAPRMDLVITVCDSAAGEACPHWPGTPLKAHWGIPDPAGVDGPPDAKRTAFEEAYRRLEARMQALVALSFTTLSTEDLKKRLAEIGAMAGATPLAVSG